MILNPYIVGDNMVLQSGVEMPIWGFGEPGDTVKITFKDRTLEADADEKTGRWLAVLPPMGADENGAEMRISDSNSNQVIKNVRVGDVYVFALHSGLMGGMNIREMRDVEDARKAERESAAQPREITVPEEAAGKYRIENCFFFNADRKISDKPEFTFAAVWTPFEIEEMHRKLPEALYYFAKAHRATYGKVPLGLVNISCPDSTIEAWTSQESLKGDSAFFEIGANWSRILATFPSEEGKWKADMEKWKQQNEKYKEDFEKLKQNKAFARIKTLKRPEYPQRPDGSGSHKTPSGLYNGVLCTVAPFAARAIFVMPSEEDDKFQKLHSRLLKTMISDWSKSWRGKPPAFVLMQTPASWKASASSADHKSKLPFIREAQEKAAAELSISILPGLFPGNAPRKKLADRLFSVASAISQGGDDFAGKIPTPFISGIALEGNDIHVSLGNCGEAVFSLSSMKLDGDQSSLLGKVVEVAQRQLKYGGHAPFLKPMDGSHVKVISAEVEEVEELDEEYELRKKTVTFVELADYASCPGFAVAGKERIPRSVEARIEGSRIVISCKSVKEPTYLFYGWADNPQGSLVNSNGIPLPPFRRPIMREDAGGNGPASKENAGDGDNR
jgi:hypothetical protein